MKYLIVSLVLLSLTVGCGIKQYSAKKGEKIKQGVAGQVFEVIGNQMPSIDRPMNENGSPVSATVYIYELTNHNNLTQESGIYSNISTKKVAAIKTADNGEFKIKLAEGIYSLFVKSGEGFYANLFDEKMNIHPITITKDQITTTKVKIDLKATY